jgi:hypothetical protein
MTSTSPSLTSISDSAGRVRSTLPPYVVAASYAPFDYTAGRTFYTRSGD